jgi:membrane-associated phospholipid phosphatase
MQLIALLNLIDIDHNLFYLVNSEWTNPFFDWLLPVWRNKYFWLPVYMFIILFAVWNYGKKSYWFILFLVAAVGASDIVSSHVIKKTIQRVRPCNDGNIDHVRTLVRCGSGYSFTSSHAANHFAVSYFLFATLGFQFKKIRGWLIAWAVSVSYAQVYVGVHFPIDVFSGMIIGILMAKLFVWLYQKSGKAIQEFA